MIRLLKFNHSILILYELLYKPGYIEFVSMFIEKIKNTDRKLNSIELKKRVKEYFTFLVKNKFIFIQCGDDTYKSDNLIDFFKILDDNWNRFEDKKNPSYNIFWYSYSIQYTQNWFNMLNELKNMKP